jgi:prepilin-type N-terminal cleavage/methylation domain-containing protein/prepilin-type processing-associated H-X9-DG protein
MKGTGQRSGFTLVELLVVITIIAILIALLLPAVQMAREAARKLQCSNNLKEDSFAMLNYEHMNGFLPSGGWGWFWVGDPDRRAGKEQPGAWIFAILPYMEQDDLYRLGSDSQPDVWTTKQAAGSTQRIGTALAAMNCPSRRQAIAYPMGYFGGTLGSLHATNPVTIAARCDYAACAGDQSDNQIGDGPADFAQAAAWAKANTWPPSLPDYIKSATGICYVRSEVSVAMIADGLSNTYMLGEKYLNPDCYLDGTDGGDNETMYCGFNSDVCRITPLAYIPLQDTPSISSGVHFGSAHPGSLNMSFCDGAVQAINYSISPETHRRLGNRQDGLPVDPKTL